MGKTTCKIISFARTTCRGLLQHLYNCSFSFFMHHLDSLTEAIFCKELGACIPSWWRVLGISLHISTEVLDSFEKKHDSNVRCFAKVFKVWKANNLPHVPFTWWEWCTAGPPRKLCWRICAFCDWWDAGPLHPWKKNVSIKLHFS